MKSATTNLGRSNNTQFHLNIRWLVSTLLAAGLAAVALYFWHGYAVRVSADRLVHQAQALRAAAQQQLQAGSPTTGPDSPAEQLQQASQLLWNYVQIRPSDPNGKVLLAEVFGEAEGFKSERFRNPQRAAELLQEAIEVAPPTEQPRLRLALAEQWSAAGEFYQAGLVARESLDDPKFREIAGDAGVASAWRILAESLLVGLATEQLSEARQRTLTAGQAVAGVVLQAIALNPGNTRLPVALAELYRGPQPERYLSDEQKQELSAAGKTWGQVADELVDAMVAANPASGRAWLGRYVYRASRLGGGREGEQRALRDPVVSADLRKALELEPDAADINLLMGGWHLTQAQSLPPAAAGPSEPQRAEWQAAKENFRKAQASESTGQLPWLWLGNTELLLGDSAAALAAWQDGLRLAPNQNPATSAELYRRIIETLIDQNDPSGAATWLKQLRDSLAAQTRDARVSTAREIQAATRTLAVLQAKLQRSRGQFGAAIAELEQVARNSSDNTQRAEIYAVLAAYCAQSYQLARAAHYFELASELEPTRPEWARAAASSLAALGRDDRAGLLFERLASLSQDPTDFRQFAEFLLAATLRRPPELRDWQRFDQVVDKAAALAEAAGKENDWRLLTLRTQGKIARAQGDSTSPNATPTPELPELDSLDALSNREPELLQQMIVIHQTLGHTDRVQALVQELQAAAPQAAESYRLPARMALQAGNLAVAETLLNSGLQAVTAPAERKVIELALAELELREQHADLALQRLDRLLAEFPDDHQILVTAIDWRVLLDQVPATPLPWEARLAEWEGPEGPLAAYFQARRAIQQAEGATSAVQRRNLLAEATRLKSRIEQNLPEWFPLQTLIGWLCLAEADAADTPQRRADWRAQALTALSRAVDLGERRPGVLFQYSELAQVDDPRRAAQILDMLDQGQVASTPLLATRKTELALELNNLAEAERVALAAVNLNRGEVSSWLMLAYVRLRQQKLDEALDAAGKAKTLAERSVDPAAALGSVFLFHVAAADAARTPAARQTQTDAARALIPAIVERFPAAEQNLQQANLLWSLRDRGASERFAALDQAGPTTDAVDEALVAYYSGDGAGDFNAADIVIRGLQRMVDRDPKNSDKKLRLADALINRGTVADWTAAQSLLADSTEATNPAALRRGRAVLLLSRRNVPTAERLANLAAAANELAAAFADPQVTPNDHLLLAQVLDERYKLLDPSVPAEAAAATTARTTAREHVVQAAAMPTITPAQLFLAASFLVQWGELEQAANLIDRLPASAGPNGGPSPNPTSLRIQLEQKRQAADSAERIQRLIDSYWQQVQDQPNLSPLAEAEHCVRMAGFYSLAGQPAAALPWFRKAAEANDAAVVNLIQALGAQQQKREAVELCRQAFAKSQNVQWVLELSNILIQGNRDLEAYAAAESLFAEAQAAFPRNARLFAAIGNCLATHPTDIEKAVAAYQQGLAIDPDDIELLNNLATVLADVPGQQDAALQHIDRALQIRGNHSALLNTRATVLMLRGDYEQALAIFDKIVNNETDERTWMNYAEANWRMFEKNQDERFRTAARKSFDIAVAKGVESAVLTIHELNRLNALKSKLSTETSSPSG